MFDPFEYFWDRWRTWNPSVTIRVVGLGFCMMGMAGVYSEVISVFQRSARMAPSIVVSPGLRIMGLYFSAIGLTLLLGGLNFVHRIQRGSDRQKAFLIAALLIVFGSPAMLKPILDGVLTRRHYIRNEASLARDGVEEWIPMTSGSQR